MKEVIKIRAMYPFGYFEVFSTEQEKVTRVLDVRLAIIVYVPGVDRALGEKTRRPRSFAIYHTSHTKLRLSGRRFNRYRTDGE